MRPDAFGICLLKQTASGAQSVASPSKIEGFREIEADLSALFLYKLINDPLQYSYCFLRSIIVGFIHIG